MKDIQFISIVDSLSISKIEEVDGSSPRSIDIYGDKGLKYAKRVSINAIGVDSFTVLSSNVLRVVLPDQAASLPITEIQASVLSSRLSSTRAVSLEFAPTMNLTHVEGIQKLVQQVVKLLLSGRGSNSFAPSDGGGLVSALGLSLSPSNSTAIATALSQAVSRTQATMTSSQNSLRSSPRSERLLSMTLLGIEFSEDTGEVSANIKIVSQAGESFSLPLVL